MEGFVSQYDVFVATQTVVYMNGRVGEARVRAAATVGMCASLGAVLSGASVGPIPRMTS